MWPLAIAVLLRLGTAAHAAVYYVAAESPAASDENPGTQQEPLETIGAAVKKAQPGDTILVGPGVYREEVEWPGEDWNDPERRITLAAAPGARPVIKGSDIVAGPWQRLPGERPIYFTPREPYTEMVFVDEQPLRQIGLQGNPERYRVRKDFVFKRQWVGRGLDDMAPGTFFYDDEAKRLYVWLADGSDPSRHVVEAAVKNIGLALKGTWTLRGFDVRHYADGLWPREQAVAVVGNRCIVEDCRIEHNAFIGLIVAGEDCIIRSNVIAYNGLEGFTSNVGYRMLFEGNELYGNAWRGDVVCLTAGNKFVMWRDSKFLRNYWHDEPAAALWLDISDGNILIAENRFDNCRCGIYFEISRWAVIANNIFRGCGQGIWVYSSDVLVAHNVLDRCGDGITVSGYPRTCEYSQAITEPRKDCLMAVRNVLIVNNLLLDCPGSFVGITEDTGYGAGNYSDYNAFVWTMPAYHPTGCHINFMNGWNQLYARLPEWRLYRHQDTHSVVADAGLAKEIAEGNEYVALAEKDVVAEAGIVDREGRDYRLRPDSPLRGRGISIPAVLNAPYVPCRGREVVTRQWAKTLVEDAPGPAAAKPVASWPGHAHYRLQPLPPIRRLVDLDAQGSGTPGLNEEWMQTGNYPVFDPSREPETADDWEWIVFPDNRLADPGFDKPITTGGPDDGPGPWFTRGDIHSYVSMACANLFPAHQRPMLAFQRVGTVAPECEYILFGDMTVTSLREEFGAIGEMYLAAGDDLKPLGTPASARAEPGKSRCWNTYFTRYRSGQGGEDATVGQPLYVVIAARVEGPADLKADAPVAFVRWDGLTLLTGEKQ